MNQNNSKNALARVASFKKRKVPEVKQTKTSMRRILNANPLIELQESISKKESLPPNILADYLTNSLNKNNVVFSKPLQKYVSKVPTGDPATVILSGNRPQSSQTSRKVYSSTTQNLSKIEFNPKVLLSSTTLENDNKKGIQTNKVKGKKPLRRSLSAQHYDRKRAPKLNPAKSLENVSQENIIEPPFVSPIIEETSVHIFKTPNAYARRSLAPATSSMKKRPRFTIAASDLQSRLNEWLAKRGKSLSTFHHLKCFGLHCSRSKPIKLIDEEDKENVESEGLVPSQSYEDLKIPLKDEQKEIENIVKDALTDLHKLVLEGYPEDQCEGWLKALRQKSVNIENEPQYWECRAAIEQSRGNIAEAVHCYRSAIVQGAEVRTIDESLDQLLEKFSLLNISPQNEDKKTQKQRSKIVQDARNIFKSSIIQFAVQERKLKINNTDEKKLIATPVRRSTRLSRCSSLSVTPGLRICSSLHELEDDVKAQLNFQRNAALI